MEFINFLLNENNVIFSSALFILVFLLSLELILFFIGTSTNMALDKDFIIDNFSWLNKGGLPFIIVLVLLLATFGGLGLIIQNFIDINQYILAIFVFIATLFIVRFLSSILSKILPKDETSIVSENSFIGKIGIVTIGVGNKENSVEFKVIDNLNRTHYIMGYVIDGELKQGEKGLIVSLNEKGKYEVSVSIDNEIGN